MKASYDSTIGRPRLYIKDDASGLTLDLELPRDLMMDTVRENARWLLHNGTDGERKALLDLAHDLLACK